MRYPANLELRALGDSFQSSEIQVLLPSGIKINEIASHVQLTMTMKSSGKEVKAIFLLQISQVIRANPLFQFVSEDTIDLSSAHLAK
jgi:hypothetical protein